MLPVPSATSKFSASIPPVNVTKPATSNVPAVATFPVASATVNLLVSIVNPPFSTVAPETVSAVRVPTFVNDEFTTLPPKVVAFRTEVLAIL